MNTQQLILTPWQAKRYEEQYRLVKRSVDARQRDIKVLLTLLTDIHGNPLPKDAPVPLYDEPQFKDVHNAEHQACIVGSGPAGLFAALTMLEHGVKPIIIERGKDVSARKRDIAKVSKNEGLNAESNYCFGEGGAGTFSDGKLFSRSKKRGNMQRVMELFHYFGAPDTVLYEAHAHIGSDCLPAIIRRMRECIISHGGEIHFNTLWSPADLALPTILAIGHSAHDTYRQLYNEGVAMEAKGCAMGVRVEHPQSLINTLMYHLTGQDRQHDEQLVSLLGNASYSLVTQVQGKGVYSFCMCPGGHIVPASSDKESCVVNGMSANRRNSPYANSGMVVECHPQGTALDALTWQENIEHTAWTEAQKIVVNPLSAAAPAQRLQDFVYGIRSESLPACSYLPDIVPSRLDKWLPKDVGPLLRQGFLDFERKHKGFLTNDAVVVGVESRSSSPIRLLRDKETYRSLSHPLLYPCGEGAGYAGGITSSALDGQNAATQLCLHVLNS